MSTDAFDDDVMEIGAEDAANIGVSDKPKPGWYFCVITAADAEKDLKKLGLSFWVLSGNVPDQEGKTFDRAIFWKDQDGKRATRAITRLLTASGICHHTKMIGYRLSPAKFAKDLVQRFVVVNLAMEEGKDGKKYLGIPDYNAAIYAPNDPATAKHNVELHGPAYEEWLKTVAGGDPNFNPYWSVHYPGAASGNGHAAAGSAAPPAVDPNAL